MLFPNTGTSRPVTRRSPTRQREGSQNGMALIKLQYQHNINSKSYFRILGASNYNWWFITGPVSADLTYGAQLPDYEVIGHNWSGTAVYARQLSDKNLINATASYMTGKLQTYSMGFFDGFMTNLVGNNGLCYDGSTGNQCELLRHLEPELARHRLEPDASHAAARLAGRSRRRAMAHNGERPERAGRQRGPEFLAACR